MTQQINRKVNNGLVGTQGISPIGIPCGGPALKLIWYPGFFFFTLVVKSARPMKLDESYMRCVFFERPYLPLQM